MIILVTNYSQCLGYEKILEDSAQKFDSCQKLYCKLEKHTCLKLLVCIFIINKYIFVCEVISEMKIMIRCSFMVNV